MSYINFGIKEINIENDDLNHFYEQGYVLTRISKGHLEKVRSIRIDLSKFALSSENRRILKKFNHILEYRDLPYENYSWQIHKMGKDFYDTKFGSDTFSANKIKEIFTNPTESNFNKALVYIHPENNTHDGFCVCYQYKDTLVHYCYPFYNLDLMNSSFGIYMMTSAIHHFKEKGFKFIYLGSAHSAESKYKFQFKGLEWFDETKEEWSEDIEMLKSRIANYESL